jgi:hypothetical protein
MTTKYYNNLDLNGTLTIAGSGGTNGYFLKTDGSGNISWASASATLGYVGGFQTTSTSGASANLSNINQITAPTNASGNVSIFAQSSATLTGAVIIGGNNAPATTATVSTPSVFQSVQIYGTTNNAATGYGGAVNIGGGYGGGTSTLGGYVYIDGGDSSNSTTGTVNIGTRTLSSGAQTSAINIGNSTAVTAFLGSTNLAGSTSTNAQGQLTYSSDTFKGWQTSTGSGRIPVLHSVFSLANSTASTNTTQSAFAAANDVLSSLEAAKLYRFRATYYSSFTYSTTAGAINVLFAFSNAPTAIKYSFKTYPQTAGTTITQLGAASVATATTVVPSQSASGTWVTEIEGYFTTHATLTSTFTPQFSCTATSGSSAVIQAGSWFEIEKLGTASQTLIAGNWG